MRKIFFRVRRLYHTVKYLKYEQIWFRLYYRFKKTNVNKAVQSNFKVFDWAWTNLEANEQSFWSNGKVKFLSVKSNLDSVEIWNDSSKSKLWLYNLHYFDDLMALGASDREASHFQLINFWIENNPPCMGNGWEPYPLSLRIVNWVKWFSTKKNVEEKYLKSLQQQLEALYQQIEYHILGNHLFANAKALIFAGCFFQGDAFKKYLVRGLEILDREISEQFLDDGAHFELSPMYHAIMLWDLFELIDLARASKSTELLRRQNQLCEIAEKGLYWFESMLHFDGEVSFFNDSAIGVAKKSAQIFDYAEKLNLKRRSISTPLISHIESGYSRVSLGQYMLLIDHANVGPDYLPGHAHADTLSFEMSVGEERIFVNSGTSQYGNDIERLRQRKTEAHNTVVVNSEDSSEVWSGFRVARRAFPMLHYVNLEGENHVELCASHNGYKRFKHNVVHERRFSCLENKIIIEDELLGSFKEAKFNLHLHPSVLIKQTDDSNVELTTDKNIKICLNFNVSVKVIRSTWHPEFGVSIPNYKIVANFIEGLLVTSILIEVC